MWSSTKGRIRFNRRRINIRKYIKFKYFFILSIIVFIISVSFIGISGIILSNKIKNSTIVYASDKKQYEINENDEVLEVYNEKHNDIGTYNSINNVQISYDKLKLCLLGEIMMGGEVKNNISNSYASCFKKVYTNTKNADFTYANFSTNITNLESIENPKSSYIVNKNVLDAIKALGIDSVSIASDHIIDFPSDIIENTINLLEKNNIFVSGRENMPVYFQKGDKRVAIVSTNSVINGTSTLYTKEGISIYDKDNLVKNIKEAKENSDFVIVDIHWGNEYTYGVTEKMQQMARLTIDSGANLVIGSHALGVYPVITYKNVPIIYSLGYFIGDLDLNVGKESFIFDIVISKENKIEEINMTPIYIKDKKEVLLYNDYDNTKSNEVLNQYNNWHIENGLNSIIDNNIIKIIF